MSKIPLTPTQSNILALYKKDPTIVNDDNRLTASYWHLFDHLNYHDHTNVYEMLKAVTPVDTIKRARRWLNEHSYIQYDKETQKEREKEYKEHTAQYSNQDIIARMREKVSKGEL